MAPPEPAAAPSLVRVAHLLDGRHFGGAEQMVRRLIAAGDRAGLDGRGYCLSEGRLSAYLRHEGLPVQVFPSRGRLDFGFLPALARALRGDRIQLLQAHTSRTHLLARLLGRRLGLPNVTTIHSPIGLDENRGLATHRLRATIERLGRPWTDHLVTVSQAERERLIAEEQVDPARISWIPNGVDPPPLADPARAAESLRQALLAAGLEAWDPGTAPPFILAMIAQMRPRKGPEVLIEAFARWQATTGAPSARLLMIGGDEFAPPGYLAGLQAQARASGIGGRILFTGFEDRPWRLAEAADLLALPSRFGEGLPLVLLEAMSRGIPLLCSDIPGNRELVGGDQAGWLHPPGDAAALACQLAEAASDRAGRAARGERALQGFAASYRLDATLAAYRRLFDRLLADAIASAH